MPSKSDQSGTFPDQTRTTPIPDPKPKASEGTLPLQFVTTTNSTTVEAPSSTALRRHAAKYGYNHGHISFELAQRHKKSDVKSHTHRFRIVPEGLKDTVKKSNRSKVVSPKGGSRSRDLRVSTNKLPLKVQPRKESTNDQLWSEERAQEWFDEMLYFEATSLSYQPATGSMDPFNRASLPITTREETLFQYYFYEEHRAVSPLIPYCRAFFSLAVQDQAVFHAVFSHYSATYRARFQNEGCEESIAHLTSAIQLVNERLGDPVESCSDGTIGAVTCLIIYESANGALQNIEYHMNGLEEMVRRRGGFEEAGFTMDLKRLIAWTDLNTANDLWQPPRFPALASPTLDEDFLIQAPTDINNEFMNDERLLFDVSPEVDFSEPTIDAVITEIKRLASQLSSQNTFPTVDTADKIHSIERQLMALIHPTAISPSFPFSSTAHPQNKLDKAVTIAALIYMRSFIRDSTCNFRTINTSKLETALEGVDEEFIVRMLSKGGDERETEKLVWVVGFGAVVSLDQRGSEGLGKGGQGDGKWFVNTFWGLGQGLGFRQWGEVKGVLDGVLWNERLDEVGLRLWEEMGTDL